tara:strand:- start:758 stop:1534 length:777 start_codon:yes stop_codon:yes gene_type:complete
MEKKNLYLKPMGGFGNRMWVYEVAYQINKRFGFPWNIIMDKKYFPEVKYIDFPYVQQGTSKPAPIIKSLKGVDKNKDYKIGSYAVKLFDELRGRYHPSRPVSLKDTILDKEIQTTMMYSVGVHIRRGDVVDSLNPKHPAHGIQPIVEDDYYRRIMNRYKGKKFYISTDGEWDEVKWLWDEYDIINKWKKNTTKEKSKYQSLLGHYFDFTQDEALDLFHLLYSETFIMGLSTWSEWVRVQRRHSNCISPPVNFEKGKYF